MAITFSISKHFGTQAVVRRGFISSPKNGLGALLGGGDLNFSIGKEEFQNPSFSAQD